MLNAKHYTEPMNDNNQGATTMNAQKDTTYNGWKNYETWAVNLWMTNDQGSDSYYRQMASEIWNAEPDTHATTKPVFTREEQFCIDMSERLKDEFEEGKNDLLEQSKRECSVWADLLNAALSEVDWHEIAEHYLDDVKESQ